MSNSQAQPFDLDVSGKHISAYIEMLNAALVSYNRFVYDSEERAKGLARQLLESGVGEFSAPFGRIVLSEDKPAGALTCLTGRQLAGARFKAMAAIHRGSIMSATEVARAKAAGQLLVSVKKEDLYLCAIAVADHARGKGLGRVLMNNCVEQAKENQCARIVLEVSSEAELARDWYLREGFLDLEDRRIEDDFRSLHLYQMAKIL
jgi:ribosomal protein S18 acetylase RimI-like enzyme